MVHSPSCGCARLPPGWSCRRCSSAWSALLATLQYRWLGQVSEAEREQLRRSLAQRAREFADEFDGEISRAYLALQVPRGEAAAGGEATARDWTGFAASLDRWKATARDSRRLIRAVYLAEAAGSEHTIRRWRFHAADLRREAARLVAGVTRARAAAAGPAEDCRLPARGLPRGGGARNRAGGQDGNRGDGGDRAGQR